EVNTDSIVREADLRVADPAYNYENGLFDFVADCGTHGFTTTIKLYYYDVSSAGMLVRKHNPNTNAFFNLAGMYGATLSKTTINSHQVTVATYNITDGGVLDIDGAVNGQIADPVGLASPVVGAPNTGFREQ